jgi:hypothetical protein
MTARKARWKPLRGSRPGLILQRIAQIATAKPRGEITFNSFEYHELMASMQSLIDFNQAIVWKLRKKAVRESLYKALRNGDMREQTFIDEVDAQLRNFLATRQEQYSLLTTISVSGERIFNTLNILRCKIRFIEGLFPKKYAERQMQEGFNLPTQPTPHNFQKIIITTEARHPHEAVHKCLASLDTYRALCCLFVNPRMQIAFSTEKTPINIMVLGGLHSLHKANGRLNNRAEYWYEPYPRPRAPVTIQPDRAKTIRHKIDRVISRIERSQYKQRLYSSLLRYVRALDETDENSAAIKAWGALESLSIEANEPTDAVIHRCSFLMSDSELHSQHLEALRKFRNENVHAGEYSEEARTYCFQLQFYFYLLLMFHVHHCDYFGSFEEASRFLDLPSDRKELKRRKEFIEKAISFRQPAE